MRKFILAMAGVAVSGAAVAQDPAWTYLDFGYQQGSVIGDADRDAYIASGSIGFADKYHIGAAYVDGTVPTSFNDDADFDGYEIWVGINPAITDTTDFVAQAIYSDLSADDDGPESDFYGARIGVRSMFTDVVELFGNVQWVDGDIDDIGDSDDLTQISVNVGGQYFFTDNLSLNIAANVSDDVVGQFGIRWSFDQ